MKKWFIVSLFTVLVLGLAACGGGDEASGNDGASDDSSSANSVDIVASNWEFDKDTYTVPAGDITFNLTNESGMHGFDIEGTDVTIEGEGSVSGSLEPGEYTIRCNIPCGEGHADMTAQLVVE
ncbi:cytochrome C oxidase subunit II [Virgibacillus sp. MSP4-1]|uniref:cytochrome c oxidase subunit II n=1 Tax=Virgibacillus sp. MSP4-1 TaxID=2700081 RepID=UPI0003A21628|nr:cytochrome c oxidase subunit II [Virgibacillus sp. MSP4-1]QHS24025.1 cytochrome C oxidase subunit II [Virgibacillus sp. MSP4-1]